MPSSQVDISTSIPTPTLGCFPRDSCFLWRIKVISGLQLFKIVVKHPHLSLHSPQFNLDILRASGYKVLRGAELL